MERLIVKNFGPIKQIDIELKDVNMFIGDNSTGKSTVAKLVGIFRNEKFWNDVGRFIKHLAFYKIEKYLKEQTYIEFIVNDLKFIYQGNQMTKSQSFESIKYYNVYIPAERITLPLVLSSIFSLMSSEVAFPKYFLDFAAKYEVSRLHVMSIKIKYFDDIYKFENTNDYIEIDENRTIPLNEVSSGIQSSVPLHLIMEYFNNDISENSVSFIIEEPELNLYPSTQKKLVEFLIGKINASGNKLTITTHSPYILTSLDNLIQANEVVRMHPQKSEEVEKIVSKELWLDYDKVSCYYFENGTCRDIKDEEFRSIGPNNIDDVSESLGLEFDKLLDLKYGK